MIREMAQRSMEKRVQEAAESETLAAAAYRLLRQDIIDRVFSPGQPLRLEFLKSRYGLSFSPLREALNRLHSERLVDSGRGFSVAESSIEEMKDATNTRILIETEALRRSIENANDEWETKIVATFHALDLLGRRVSGRTPTAEETADLESRHHEFHRALIENCRSRRLLDLADQLFAETQRYRLPALTGRAGSRDIPGEHRRIMEATIARRPEEATALLAEHYRKTSDFIEKTLSAS